MADHQAPPGGSGGEPADRRRRIHDVRLFARALRETWPIPKDMRPVVIERLREVIEDTDSSPREVTAASTVILQASRINLDVVATAVKAREADDLADRMAVVEDRLRDRAGNTPGKS